MRSSTFETYSGTASQRPEVQSKMTEPVWVETEGTSEFVLDRDLPELREAEIMSLRSKCEEPSFLQLPAWDRIVTINGEKLYFTYRDREELRAFAIVRLPNPRIAKIDFGPVGVTKEDTLRALQKLLVAVRESTRAWYLQVQLPWQEPLAEVSEETKAAVSLGARTFDDKRNWASSFIDTKGTDEELKKNFSKNHKRSINKATKLGLETRELTSDEDVGVFNDIFVRMYAARGETIDPDQNRKEYIGLRDYFARTGEGFFFGVFEAEELIGGMIIVRQGDYGFYHHSASDPEKRKIPVLHLGVFKVLEELRQRGIRYFDFGGYNPMADESDQVYNINRFKDGFTKNYLRYPKIMYFEFVPGAVFLLEKFQAFKDVIKRLVRK